jgi:hypothetical protein
MLSDVIQCSPWSLSLLAAAGSSALDAYAGFIDDCVQLAQDHARSVQSRSSVAQPTLRWKLKLPSHWTPNCENKFSSLEWLKNIGVLRGRALFDNGRRPGFRTPDGGFLDPDPIDAHAFHILACDGARLVGACGCIISNPTGLFVSPRGFSAKEHFRKCFKRWTPGEPKSSRSGDGLSTRDTEPQSAISASVFS